MNRKGKYYYHEVQLCLKKMLYNIKTIQQLRKRKKKQEKTR